MLSFVFSCDLNYRGNVLRLTKTSPFAVVDGVSEPGGVHDGQLQLHALLLDVHRVLRDLHRLTDSLWGQKHRAGLQPSVGPAGVWTD